MNDLNTQQAGEREVDVGNLEYRGNSVSWWHQKAKAYGDTVMRMHKALQEAGYGANGQHVENMLCAALAQPTSDTPAASASTADSVTIDFKQATDLLEMFGGEPTEITLMTGAGHSGEGLYAVYNADPEGSVYLGKTDEEAAPVSPPPADAQGDATSIYEMCQLLNSHLIEAEEYTDCTIVYRVTFEQLRNLYDAGRAAPPADAQGDAEIVEAVAWAIYDQWQNQDGFKPWQFHGNSDKQEEARAIARKAIATKPAAAQAAPSAGRYCNKCGYFGPDMTHQRPNGSGECHYISTGAQPTQPTSAAQGAEPTCGKEYLAFLEREFGPAKGQDRSQFTLGHVSRAFGAGWESKPTTAGSAGDALIRILPVFEALLTEAIFTTEQAGQVAADMSVLRDAARQADGGDKA